jgi:hypothetical protein
MTNFIKYKDVIYIHCFGPNDEYSALNKGRYSNNGLKMNSKIFRFNLGSDLNSLKLSKNAKFQLLFLTMPAYYDTTAYSDFSLLRLRTPTECKIWDSYKKHLVIQLYINNLQHIFLKIMSQVLIIILVLIQIL